MKNILLIALLSIVALSAYATDPAIPDHQNHEPEVSSIQDSDMDTCLKAHNEQLQTRIFENLFALSKQASFLEVQTPDTTSELEIKPQSLAGELLALNTAPTPQAF